jgi:signal transduction histidine kinase
MNFVHLYKLLNIYLLDITFMITVGIASMLLLAAGFMLLMVVNQRKKWLLQKQMSQLKEQQQNQLIEAAVRSEEGERHRIAELLHDEVGALLSSSRIFLVEMNTQNLSVPDKEDHAKVKEMIDESIQKVRSISHNLHSSILKEFGLNEALRHFMKKITGGTAIQSQLDLDESYVLSTAETDLAVYRIIQELVNNILKHAHAKNIDLHSELLANVLCIRLHHDGNGLTQQEFEELRFKPEGLGLKNIQNRIILLKGKIHFEKNNLQDAVIKLSIPVQQ